MLREVLAKLLERGSNPPLKRRASVLHPVDDTFVGALEGLHVLGVALDQLVNLLHPSGDVVDALTQVGEVVLHVRGA